MGAACSVGAMRKISSEEFSDERNKQAKDVKQSNNIKNKVFLTVKSFGRLNVGNNGKKTKKKKKTLTDDDDSSSVHSSPVRFYSSELRFSFSNKDPGDKGTKGSLLGRASFAGLDKAVDVLDALGSGMANLNSSGFLTGKVAKGNKISILAFEVANTITKGANLMHSLSEENVKFIKEQVIPSQGVQYLVSTDTKVLLGLAAADKREELAIFCKEVIRFGNLCKDAQWHNLDRFFSKLDTESAVFRQEREQAEAKMQELMSLAQNTSELYHELNTFDRFEQDYRQKFEEMKSLNLPRKGEHLMMLHGELRQQRKTVMGLKRKSLWSKKLEEIIEKLVDIVAFIQQEITEEFEIGGVSTDENSDCNQRLGDLGLALHYANLINQIDNIASRPTSVPSNIRDTLYRRLPASVKNTVRSSLRKLDSTKELEVPKIKAEMEKILEWLSPMAANTMKAHQGFGWVGEWANSSMELNRKSAVTGNLIRLQTLHHANKEKMDSYTLTLVTLLHYLINGVRHRNCGLKTIPLQSPSNKILGLNKKVKTSTSLYDDNILVVELTEEDRRLLDRMSKSRSIPGISKSQEFTTTDQRMTKSWRCNRSMHSSPHRDQRRNSRTQPLDDTELDLVTSGLKAPF